MDWLSGMIIMILLIYALWKVYQVAFYLGYNAIGYVFLAFIFFPIGTLIIYLYLRKKRKEKLGF